MGRGAPQLSEPPGDPLAHAAPFPHCGLDSPDLRPSGKPPAGAVAAIEALAQAPSVAGPSRGHDQGAQAVASPGGRRGLLVGRGQADVAHAVLSPLGNSGLKRACSHGSIGSTRWPTRAVRRRKAKLRQALEAMQGAFDQHALTLCLPPHALQAWHAWATHRVSAFQRASSAVEGRNGALRNCITISAAYPNSGTRCGQSCITSTVTRRMVRPQPRAFSGGPFPDLFETVLAHIEALPQPRRRKRQVGLCH